MTPTREQRFWAKVQQADGCWLWLASKQPRGYGHFWFEERVQPAHRVAFRLAKGAIPDGMLVLHSCDNPQCVNPDHLSLGTAQDNSTDMIRKGRTASGPRSGAHTHPETRVRGESCSWGKLSERDVRAIRESYGPSCSQTTLARRYGINPTTVWNILHRRIWKHVA